MKSRLLVSALVAACAAASGAAQAQQLAYASLNLELHAGPDPSYPAVVLVPAGSQLLVHGCIENYAWCDVAAGFHRGWVYGALLQYPYQSAYQPLPMVAGVAGVTIIGFTLNDYWHRHYRDRSWYHDRHRWDRPPPRGTRPPKTGSAPPAARPPGQQAAPIRSGPSNPNSGWDRNNPDAPRPDKP